MGSARTPAALPQASELPLAPSDDHFTNQALDAEVATDEIRQDTVADDRASNGSYDADSIETLEGLEAVRKRPAMYVGGNGSDGLMHLLWEIVDNAVDEAAADCADRVDVTLHRSGQIEVVDDGRGIPVDIHAKRDVSALEVVFSELHAGGKFSEGVYKASGGAPWCWRSRGQRTLHGA